MTPALEVMFQLAVAVRAGLGWVERGWVGDGSWCAERQAS